MAARLANTTYWSACIAAVPWAFFVFAIGAVQIHPDWTISTPIAIAGAVVIWIVGRAARCAGRYHRRTASSQAA
jgi:hypothetical protein